MTSSWDSFGPGPAPARPRRIRGGEIPIPSSISWREQKRIARAQAAAARAQAGAPADTAAGQPDLAFRIFGIAVEPDAIFAFGLFLPLIYMVQFGTVGAAAIAGLTPLYLFVRRRGLTRLLAPRAFLFAFPAFALFTGVYSTAPAETLKYALELWVTAAAALLLSSARNQRAVLRAIALAFTIYVAHALRTGAHATVGVSGSAFSGLTDSKNLMADIASTGLITSLAVVLISVVERRWLWVAICTLAAAMEIYAVVAARSAGALLGLAMGLAPLMFLSPLVAAGRVLRGFVTAAVALTLAIVGLNFETIAAALMTLGEKLFDKDSTLTGRTYLWYRAFDLIRERPMLGQGYFSFWLQGSTDAEGLWEYAGIAQRSGFNFHNTLVDLLVTVGWLGAGVLILSVLIGAAALVRRFVCRPSLPLVFWISIFLYEMSRTPIETLGIQPFAFSTTLVFGALGAAFVPLRGPRPAHRPIRTAAASQVWPIDYAQNAWANPRLAPLRGSFRIRRKGQAE
jgi:exopolysaccharide production protein ExoQ